MDRSPLTRRGALTAAMATTAALAVPVTAHASTSKAGAATVGQLMPKIPKGKVLRVALVDSEHAHLPLGSTGKARLTDDGPLPNDTMGWDTVSAVTLRDVNRAIAKNAATPDSWRAEIPASRFSPRIEATGGFDAWSLTPGGTGTNILMQIPFNAKLVLDPDGREQTVYDIQGGRAVVEVYLAYHTSSKDNNVTELKLQSLPSDSGKEGHDDDKPLAMITHLGFTEPVIKDPDEQAGVVRSLTSLLGQWLNARDGDKSNLGRFDHVFATVDLNTAEAQGELSWLKPTTREYAYLDGENLDTCYLGVLCMTENRDPGRATQELAAGAMIDGAEATFTISTDRMLNKMIMPSVQHHFPDGKFVATSGALVSKGEFSLDSVKAGGITYHPKATSFRFSVSQQTLRLEMNVHIPISPGIDGYATMSYTVRPTMSHNKKGEPNLSYELIEQSSQHWYEIASWLEKVELAVDVIVLVVAAAAGAAIAVGERVIVKVIIAAATALVASLPEIFAMIPVLNAKDALANLPGILAMVNAVTAPITWADAKAFDPTQAMINGGLQVGGNCFGK